MLTRNGFGLACYSWMHLSSPISDDVLTPETVSVCFTVVEGLVDRGPSPMIEVPVTYDLSTIKAMKRYLDSNVDVKFVKDPTVCIFFFRPFRYGEIEEGIELVAGLVTPVRLFEKRQTQSIRLP